MQSHLFGSIGCLDLALGQLGLDLLNKEVELLPHHHLSQVKAANNSGAVFLIRTIRAVDSLSVANVMRRNASPVVGTPNPVVTTATGRWAVDLVGHVTAVVVTITNPTGWNALTICAFKLVGSAGWPLVAHDRILVRAITAVNISVADPSVVKTLSIVALEPGSGAWLGIWIANFGFFVRAISTIVVKVTNPSGWNTDSVVALVIVSTRSGDAGFLTLVCTISTLFSSIAHLVLWDAFSISTPEMARLALLCAGCSKECCQNDEQLHVFGKGYAVRPETQ